MNMEIEQAIIGAMLSPKMIDDVMARVNEDMFSTTANKAVFRSFIEVSESGVMPDMVTVSNAAKRHGIDAAWMLSECCDMAPLPHQLKSYLTIFSDNYRLRSGKELAKCILGHTGKGSEIDDMMAKHIETSVGSAQVVRAKESLPHVVDSLEQRYTNRGRVSGIETGFHRIDSTTSGLVPGRLIVVAARPSIGKTALAMNIVENVSIRNEIPSLVFSLEMTRHELVERLLLSMSDIPSELAKVGNFGEDHFRHMMKTAQRLSAAPLWINDDSGLTMTQIRAIARSCMRREGIKLIVIDYLGLVDGQGTEYERVTEASRSAKKLAKDLGVAVIAVHQLNRGSEQRAEKRPTMSDLRSSGQIEQDADVIILLHRKKEEPTEEAEIIVDKNRFGPTGIIRATWEGQFCRYTES